MIRVLDEQRSVHFYHTAFGLKVAERLDFSDFTLIYLRGAESDFEIELTINKDQAEPYEMGAGYGHIAFVVDDLDAEYARIKAAGLAPRNIVDFKPGGALLARFFFIKDPDGYEIEVIERHGRYS